MNRTASFSISSTGLACLVLALSALAFAPEVSASQTNVNGPAGSGTFGSRVTVLPNGNFVITDPTYTDPANPGVTGIGAVYLYDGSTLAIISTLKGGTANDNVGSIAITVLTNGNFVVKSPNWDNPSPANINVGAVTWCSATTGCNGTISAANSLVGGTANDSVGSLTTALTNGNYVVSSPNWNNPSGPLSSVGAVTWGNGTGGTVGLVSSANSLIGGTANDNVGSSTTALTNGNYVVSSPNWNNPSPAMAGVGAATWCNGAGGTVGLVSSANSLVGGTANDQVGYANATALPNGNYVVSSPNWDNPSPATTNVGAVTWCDGTGGTVGLVSSTNSLIGGTANDNVGSLMTALTNGNYVVSSPTWNNPSPAKASVGAVTWCSGLGGTFGLVSSANSLIGGTANDQVGHGNATALTNGNYVVSSPNWSNPSGPFGSAGAVTWGNGLSGTVGVVSSANSLVGGTAFDQVSGGSFNNPVTALANGNYVVSSPTWDNPIGPIANAGAVTWGNGTGGTVGLVSSANSLIGGTTSDDVGLNGARALTNGNYVVASNSWTNPSGHISGVGAVTWGNGAGGTVGLVSSANSLIGGSASDDVGYGVWALTNGNYVVDSPQWGSPSPAKTQVGAVTWGNGMGGTVGMVSSSNALIGGTALDRVGYADVTTLTNGNYVVSSPYWDDPIGPITNAGAVTLGNGNGGTVGLITSAHSVLGTVASVYANLPFSFDVTRNRLIVGRPASNVVSILANRPASVQDDFDGDSKTDIGIFRPSGANGAEWWYVRSSTGTAYATQFGAATDKIVAADFTGDGKTDIAFFRPSTGQWFVLRSEDSSFYSFPFGASGDIPVPADFDGDGKADAAVFRPSTATWYISNSGGGTTITQFGLTTDLPVPGDYDGDGKADVAVYRPTGANGSEWWISKSTGGTFATQFGAPTDKAVPGDYTGDGKTDIAFFRPSTGTWYVLRSEDLSFYAFPFGTAGDSPVPGDYDGDGKTDAGVFRASNSTWYVNRSTAGVLIQQFGTAGDLPIPNAFVR